MYIEVTPFQAARFLSQGVHVHDGFYWWAGAIELEAPHRYRKARKLRKLTRKLAGPWSTGDGWWVYKKEA